MKLFIRDSVYEELEDIWLYTSQNWGVEQADQYIQELMNRFSWLAENPHAGKSRDDIKAGYRCYPQGGHLAFYQIQTDHIDILSVPHQSMDVETYFG